MRAKSKVIVSTAKSSSSRIGLRAVPSKYIGETEKNLSTVLARAEDSNALLSFDEGDALLGKRSAVKDAHDRFANLEVTTALKPAKRKKKKKT